MLQLLQLRIARAQRFKRHSRERFGDRAGLRVHVVGRFVDALRAMAEKTQFIVITHNPRTIEAANVIYGVSMGGDNTSRVLSVRLSDPLPE